MQNTDTADTTEVDTKDKLVDAAKCLLKYVEIHGSNNQAFDILKFLASETIQRITQNQNGWQFTNEAIHKAIVGGNKDSDYSSWFSRHWHKLSQISQAGLEDFARENENKHYAWIDKKSGGGSGNQSLYFLVAKLVEDNITQLSTNSKDAIRYIEITNVSPSWWARWLFDQDNLLSGIRKLMYVLYPILELLLAAIFIITIWFAIAFKKQPVSTQDLVLLFSFLLIFFYIRHSLQNWTRLLEDRIVMAPDNLLSWAEIDVSLELITTNDKESKVLRLVKYASQCQICGAEILLGKGEPDFPRRIVGRCKESPREHVYSFDRITREGSRLN